MMVSRKLIVIGAAGVLGVAMAAGGASAATGSLTAHDSPGHVVQVSGVVPVSAQASPTATTRANHNTMGRLSGATVARPTARATTHATMQAAVRQVARPAAQPLRASHAYRSDCGSDYGQTGMSGSGWHMR